MATTTPATLQERFSVPRYLWVVTYRITHSAMVLAIHDGYIRESEELAAGGCVSFRGELQGGPYRLRVATAGDDLRLYDEDGAFELVCSRLYLTGHRGPSAEIVVDGPKLDLP